ncbi:MAG: hypothetical protein QXG18_01240 [Candidatus Pacearchaeota archaeon]
MSLAHKSPIVKSIIFNLIREVHYENFREAKKYSIDVSLIPKINEDYFLKEGYKSSNIREEKNISILPITIKEETENNQRFFNITKDEDIFKEEKNEKSYIRGYKESLINEIKNEDSNVEERRIVLPVQKRQIEKKEQYIKINLFINPPEYGKLNIFMRDPKVSIINCEGPDKPLKIIKFGRQYNTKISLNKKEIMNLLYQISAKTRIPLIEEGVYRVSWDDFIINAIISEQIETSFVIKRI